MSDVKSIVVDTSTKRGQLFRVTEVSGRFYVYDVEVRFLGNINRKLGDTRSLKDAIELIKASVQGSVINMSIRSG